MLQLPVEGHRPWESQQAIFGNVALNLSLCGETSSEMHQLLWLMVPHRGRLWSVAEGESWVLSQGEVVAQVFPGLRRVRGAWVCIAATGPPPQLFEQRRVRGDLIRPAAHQWS